MFRLHTTQAHPIGLDLGQDNVKMLQLDVAGSSLKVHAAARRAIEAPAAEPERLLSTAAAGAIRSLLRTGDFRGRHVVANLPRQIVHVKNLRLPPMPASELASVVQFEARNLFSIEGAEAHDAHIEFQCAGEVRQGMDVRQEVIALAARRSQIDQFVQELHEAGLIVDSLDVEPCALYRMVERFVRRREDEQEVHVLIDLGMRRCQVVIGRGKEISFFKALEMGGSKLNEAVGRKLGISTEEARELRRRMAGAEEGRASIRQAVVDATRLMIEDLAREITLCLRYYSVTFRGQRPTRVRLMGGESGDPHVLAVLNSVLGVPVESGRPLYSVDCRAMRGFNPELPSGEWAMATGLALKRILGSFAPQDGTPRAKQATPHVEVVDMAAAIPTSETQRAAEVVHA